MSMYLEMLALYAKLLFSRSPVLCQPWSASPAVLVGSPPGAVAGLRSSSRRASRPSSPGGGLSGWRLPRLRRDDGWALRSWN